MLPLFVLGYWTIKQYNFPALWNDTLPKSNLLRSHADPVHPGSHCFRKHSPFASSHSVPFRQWQNRLQFLPNRPDSHTICRIKKKAFCSQLFSVNSCLVPFSFRGNFVTDRICNTTVYNLSQNNVSHTTCDAFRA